MQTFEYFGNSYSHKISNLQYFIKGGKGKVSLVNIFSCRKMFRLLIFFLAEECFESW